MGDRYCLWSNVPPAGPPRRFDGLVRGVSKRRGAALLQGLSDGKARTLPLKDVKLHAGLLQAFVISHSIESEDSCAALFLLHLLIGGIPFEGFAKIRER